MGRADFLALGDWNDTCFECGRKRKASTLRKHWQGYYVCQEHWEPRHPQDFVRGVPDNMQTPWVQAPIDTFIKICNLETSSAVPGLGGPGCLTPSRPYLGESYPVAFIGGRPVFDLTDSDGLGKTAAAESGEYPPFCNYLTYSAIPGYGGPGCLVPGVIL